MPRVRSTSIPSDIAYRATALTLRAAVGALGGTPTPDDLPAGVCGRVTGIALTYDQVDDYGTVFAPGCLAKTRAEKVMNGKVKLFADHGPFTHTHVGTVRALDDVGDAVLMTADLFDTEAGRKMKEYLDAVLSSSSETGLSVGFRGRDKEWRQIESGETVLVYKEIELREISITPVPAVPGTDVTSVRSEDDDAASTDVALLVRTLRSILKALPEGEARTIFGEMYPTTPAPNADQPDTMSAPVETSTPAGPSDAEPASDRADGEQDGTAMTTAPEPTLATAEERTTALRATYRPARPIL